MSKARVTIGKVGFVACVLAVSGCASIAMHTVSVITPGAEGADCGLLDSKENRYFVNDTPGSVKVRRGDGPLTVTCEKEGFKKATATFDEKYPGTTGGGMVLQALFIGPFSAGAAATRYKYPDELRVFLEPIEWESGEQRQQWLDEKAAYEDQLKQQEPVYEYPE